ncbi:hypothetical protein MOBT1_001006 [Malassezia obtusa]|uniref:RING-type domain-containing protein n=1 Tax=Malassezia obtusa TaxID=76774 RepID=A0AAF0E0C8_9BASI|nr:hypothetical protein MOBT1_001006 [Malassezia obtusa]
MAQQPRPPPSAPPAPPPLPDGPVRLYGPDVGDHFGEQTYLSGTGETSVPTSTLEKWIEGEGKRQISSLDLYVHLHRTTAQLSTFSQSTQPDGSSLAGPMQALDPETAKQLQLTAPTHTLSVCCDCVAPRARLDLYIMHANRLSASATPPLRTAFGAPHPPGWRFASADVVHGLEMRVALPLLLDQQWAHTQGARPLELALVIEALDEDGHVLAEPNAQTMYFTAESVDDGASWRLHNGAQSVYINGYAMQLHQLFGMTAHQDGPTVHEADADTSQAPVVPDPDLGNDATECPICMTLEPTTILLPCTHALCLECAVRVRESVEKSRTHDRNQGRPPRLRYACPICRATIQSMLALSR